MDAYETDALVSLLQKPARSSGVNVGELILTFSVSPKRLTELSAEDFGEDDPRNLNRTIMGHSLDS